MPIIYSEKHLRIGENYLYEIIKRVNNIWINVQLALFSGRYLFFLATALETDSNLSMNNSSEVIVHTSINKVTLKNLYKNL